MPLEQPHGLTTSRLEFLLIRPVETWILPAQRLPNILLRRPRVSALRLPHNYMAMFRRRFDSLFLRTQFSPSAPTRSSSYEYFSYGLPVVSTRFGPNEPVRQPPFILRQHRRKYVAAVEKGRSPKNYSTLRKAHTRFDSTGAGRPGFDQLTHNSSRLLALQQVSAHGVPNAIWVDLVTI